MESGFSVAGGGRRVAGLVFAALGFLGLPVWAQLPESFTVSVDRGGGEIVELNLSKHSVRSADFRVVSWDSTSGYVVEHTAASPNMPVRTYRGYVTEYPNELVVGLVDTDDTLDAEVHGGSGRLWTVSNIDVTSELAGGTSTTPTPAPLASGSAPAGAMAGGVDTTYIPPVGLYVAHGVYDIPSSEYRGSVDASLAWLEYQWNVFDFFNARDARIQMELSEVLVRKEQFYTPANGNWSQFVSMLRTEWLAQGANTRGFIASAFPTGFSYAGGYAVGNSFYEVGNEAIAVNALYHENAHNWRAQHYYYGVDTMSGSHPAHGEMNAMRILQKRQDEIDEGDLQLATSYATNLHPRAFIDVVSTMADTSVDIDPLANDWDANGDSLTLGSYTTSTVQGGTVTDAGGILTYTPAPGYTGKDLIVYEVEDAAGLATQGLIHIEVIDGGLAAHWSMEEASGSTASDTSGNGHAGDLVGTDFAAGGVPGPVGQALSLGNGDYVIGDSTDLIAEPEDAYPLEERASNFFDPMDHDFSASCWFRLDEGGTAYLVSKMNRGGFGFRLSADTGGVTATVRPWDGNSGSYTVSGGSVAAGAWHHAAMVIDRGSNHLRLYVDGAEVGSAASLPADLFIFAGRDDLVLGSEAAVTLDEVRIHTKALSLAEVQASYVAGDVPAHSPEPADGSLNQAVVGAVLTWVAGQPAYQHDVYFGTDAAAVAAATTASPEYQGQQAGVTFDPGALDYSSNYYWRVDEVDGATIIPGEVWSFSTAPSALMEDLVLHLTMDDEDVQTADGVTHSYDDIAVPATDFEPLGTVTPGAPGVIGEAVDLTGATDTLRSRVVDPVVRPASGGVSFSFWLKTSSTQSSGELVYSAGGAYFMLYENGDLRPVFDGSSGGSAAFDTNINDNLWHHIVALNDGTGLTSLYVDGVLAGTQSEGLYDVDTLDRTMAIGSLYDDLGDNLEATIDDFAVWQRALTPGEVTAIHGLGLTGASFSDVPLLVDTSFEPAEGFTGFAAGVHSALGTVADSAGVIWTEVADARIWNRADIPPDRFQVLALGINATTSQCDLALPGADHGVGVVSFDYASFSSFTDATLRLLYNDNTGGGWVEAWALDVVGNNPAWETKPWATAEVAVNVPGDVDLRFEVVGTNGCMIDNIRVEGLVVVQNQPPVVDDLVVGVPENAGSGYAVTNVGASDPDAGDSLTYAITSGNGSGLFAIDSSGNVTATTDLDFEMATQHVLVVEVVDSGGLSDTATVTIDVANVNEAPEFTSALIAGAGGMVFAPYVDTLAGEATDPDTPETLTYSIVSGPAWLVVDPGGSLSGTPGGGDGGLNSFVIQVSDAGGESDTATLEITVSDTGTVFLEDFQSYDVENPTDFSVGGAPTGNWTSSNNSVDATRIYNTSNFGGTRLWVCNVDGTSITTKGLPVGAGAEYSMSVVLVTETATAGRTLNATYDILIGPDAGSAVSIIGGAQAVVTNGDAWSIDDSKVDHVFTENFQTGSVNPGDQLFLRFERVGTLVTGGWFGVDDVQLDLVNPLVDADGDGDPDVTDPDDDNDGIPDAWELSHGLDPFTADSALDPDGDGRDNLDEYVADTDPNDPGSFLQLIVEVTAGSGVRTLRFQSSAAREYALFSKDWLGQVDWDALSGPSLGTGGSVSVMDAEAGGKRFYLLEVQVP